MQDRLPLHACEYTEQVFRVLGKRWTGMIVDLLLQRPARFGELAEALTPLSNRVLAERLGELQDAGLVERAPAESAAVSLYRLTEKGVGLAPAMAALRIWAGAPSEEISGQPATA